ncbi:transposase [bacterium]|nr:transposase [bacterium]
MPSNNSKYSPEMREQTARFILENNRSATAVAEEMGIDTNTVCRWVRDYRRANNLPTYAEERGIAPFSPKPQTESSAKVKQLEREIKRRDRLLAEEREKVEILKKSLHIFMQPQR